MGLIPGQVLAAAVGRPEAVLLDCAEQPIATSTGAATGTVTRLSGRAGSGGREYPFSLIRKELRPLASGRHAAGATDPGHWAYWRREALAYASGVLPVGPGLAAPRCYGVVDETLYLEDVKGPPDAVSVAAHRLGEWQARAHRPDVEWLAGNQLEQRLAVSQLDWSAVAADPKLSEIWARREELLRDLRSVPDVLSHGDFHIDQLVATGDRTVVLDWATLGTSPVGADLAHLALSTLQNPMADYLAGAGGRVDPAAVERGYRTTLALTGVSRVHWMLSRAVPVPDGYVDFVVNEAG